MIDLTKLSNIDIVNELEISKKYFKDKLNIETDVFCYPFGKVNKKVYKD